MKAFVMNSKILKPVLLAAIVVGLSFAVFSAQYAAHAQTQPTPKVGQTLTVTSFQGLSILVGNSTPRHPPTIYPTTLQFTWKVTKVNPDGSWLFSVTGGNVTGWSDSYSVVKGHGIVRPSGVVNWSVQGIADDGGKISYSCSGILGTVNGQTINAMNGILKDGNQKWDIRFLATIQ